MSSAFAYLRVSGKGQERGQGFERQEETIRHFAKKVGYQVVAVYRDTFTGTADALDRPAFAEMIAGMDGVQTIIVERMDRLARTVMVQEHTVTWLAAHDIALIVADTGENVTEAYLDDPMKKALVQMQAVFAELEKSIIVKKLRAGRMKAREKRGKVEGRKAYGEVDATERQGVQRIRQLRRKPKGRPRMGYRRIAHVLQREGWPTRQGGTWDPNTVRSIINGPVYADLGRRGTKGKGSPAKKSGSQD